MTTILVANVDYLTLVLAGAYLFHLGVEATYPGKLDIVVAAAGTFLFVVGAGRALMQVLGL